MSEDKIILTRKEYNKILIDIDALRDLFLKSLDNLAFEPKSKPKTKSSMPVNEVKD